MAHPVLAILGQVAEKAAESEIVRSAASVLEKIEQVRAGVSEALVSKVEAAAHSAGKFFGISDADLIVGRAIEAYHNCDVFVKNTVFEFVLDLFKDVTGVSYVDMIKIWTHECGCRVFEKDDSLSSWTKELGADFYTGVRSEMLGLPKSDFEKMLESSKGSETSPEGTLRVNAIQYGRDVVRHHQANGIEPTIENCKEAFVNSPYSKITYESHHIESNSSVWVDKTDSLHLETSTKERGIGDYPKFEKLSEQFKAFLSNKALEARVEAAAHSACKFFDIPDAKLVKGDAIGVYRGCDVFLDNDVFEYNLDQFKDMKCVSFEDMTKIWAHECGHRIMGEEFKDSWTKELGADFFSGVRSEMLGLPKSSFEKMLGTTTSSVSHPVGSLRVQAIQFGREVVRGFQEKGITPTIENCKKAFSDSQFSKITYENQGSPKFNENVKNKLRENAELPRDTDNTNSNPNRVEDAKLSKDSSVGKKSEINESQINEVKKTGGSYGELKKEWGWHSEPPKENHHMPSNESSYLDINDGPAITMDYQDHKQTASWDRSREAQEYRAKQKELIDQGKFREAMQMDIDDIHEKFGTKYDEGINQMLDYCKELETNKII